MLTILRDNNCPESAPTGECMISIDDNFFDLGFLEEPGVDHSFLEINCHGLTCMLYEERSELIFQNSQNPFPFSLTLKRNVNIWNVENASVWNGGEFINADTRSLNQIIRVINTGLNNMNLFDSC
ncbi:hypothetical protein JW978_03145 [Candidatus Dojkabacteria bacterium]|nr:hypothetical protein [Candidatus Dojkabacteria bacterium]